MWSRSPWLTRYRTAANARLRLLCFPHAGSSAAAYGSWPDQLPDAIEVCAVEYPGRGSRRAERPFVRIDALVAALLASTFPAPKGPLAIFGHSFGALVGFELARQLPRLGFPAPVAFVTAGCRAPALPPRQPPTFSGSDDALIAELRRMNGTPPEMLDRTEFRPLFLPPLRADLEAAETYAYRPGKTIATPIIAYGGTDDEDAPPDEVQSWAAEAGTGFRRRLYPGDHFFLRDGEPRILEDLANDLLSIADSRA